MSTLNYVESEIEVVCTDPDYCLIASTQCKKRIRDFNCCIIDGNTLQVFVNDTVETNFMGDYATNFLKSVISITEEYDAGAEIEGTISWKDDFYNSGEVHIVKDGDKHAVSELTYMDREASVIHEASDETLIKALEKRGYVVFLKSDTDITSETK